MSRESRDIFTNELWDKYYAEYIQKHYTRLHHGLTVVDYETELEEENVDEEETEV